MEEYSEVAFHAVHLGFDWRGDPALGSVSRVLLPYLFWAKRLISTIGDIQDGVSICSGLCDCIPLVLLPRVCGDGLNADDDRACPRCDDFSDPVGDWCAPTSGVDDVAFEPLLAVICLPHVADCSGVRISETVDFDCGHFGPLFRVWSDCGAVFGVGRWSVVRQGLLRSAWWRLIP